MHSERALRDAAAKDTLRRTGIDAKVSATLALQATSVARCGRIDVIRLLDDKAGRRSELL